jgi:hypothetical protein
MNAALKKNSKNNAEQVARAFVKHLPATLVHAR